MIVLAGYRLNKDQILRSDESPLAYLDCITKNRIQYNKYMLGGYPVFQIKDQFFIGDRFLEIPFSKIMESEVYNLKWEGIHKYQEKLINTLDYYDIEYDQDEDFNIWILN